MNSNPIYIPLVFCFDNKFAPYAAVAIYSYHIASKHPLKIYCVTSALTEESTSFFKQLNKAFSINISLIDVGQDSFRGWKEVNHISRAAYLRLLIPDKIPEDRVIYLDCDTLGLGDLRELFETNLDGAPMAGALDEIGGKTTKLPFQPDDHYINSGVLVMDLQKLRDDHFLERCQEIYHQYSELITWVDQCIINKYAEGYKAILSPHWNHQVYANQLKYSDWDELIKNKDASIIHFVGGVKPWVEWCNPKVLEFWRSYVEKMQAFSIPTIKVTSTDHALSLVSILDLNGEFERSGIIKNQIIDSLMMVLQQRMQ